MLQKQALIDLKNSKICWRLGFRPRPRWGSLRRSPDPLILRGIAPSALATPYFVSILRSQFLFPAPSLLNSWIRHWPRQSTRIPAVHLRWGQRNNKFHSKVNFISYSILFYYGISNNCIIIIASAFTFQRQCYANTCICASVWCWMHTFRRTTCTTQILWCRVRLQSSC